jgi:hypothetical protein
MNTSLNWLAPAVALTFPLAALAQPATADSGKVGALATPPAYRSAFADYKPWQDSKPGDWKAMNDAVGRSGGHSMSMPMEPTAAPAAPETAASKPPIPGRSGHEMHMQGGKK